MLNILIADDHRLVIDGLLLMLREAEDCVAPAKQPMVKRWEKYRWGGVQQFRAQHHFRGSMERIG